MNDLSKEDLEELETKIAKEYILEDTSLEYDEARDQADFESRET